MTHMTTRNRPLGKQLQAALRASRWDAGVLAFRAGVSRSTMARALVGDTSLTLNQLEVVAEQLEVNLGLKPWGATGAPPAPGGAVYTAVDRARARLVA